MTSKKLTSPTPVRPTEARDDVRLKHTICPYCHETSSHGGVVCDTCLTRHHAACWDEGGHHCSACGGRIKLESLVKPRVDPPLTRILVVFLVLLALGGVGLLYLRETEVRETSKRVERLDSGLTQREVTYQLPEGESVPLDTDFTARLLHAQPTRAEVELLWVGNKVVARGWVDSQRELTYEANGTEYRVRLDEGPRYSDGAFADSIRVVVSWAPIDLRRSER